MNDTPPARNSSRYNQPSDSAGLRLRIWLGCLGGAMVAGGGIWWVLGAQAWAVGDLDVPKLVAWLAAVAGLGILVGAGLAMWLDHGITGHLRGVTSGLARGQVSELRGLPAASGWGELSRLTHQVQLLLTQHRQALRAAEELGMVRQQIVQLHRAAERWAETEQWPTLRAEPGLLSPLVDTLTRGFRRLDEVRDQNQEAARQIGGELDRSLEDAREAAEQAERGFVEATALLTSVRELQRLGGEMGQAISPVAAANEAGRAASDSYESYRSAARAAIEELVTTSADSVEHLANGMLRVQQIADQVHLLANRATLIALDATTAGSGTARSESEREELVGDMKRLAEEVRAATDRTSQLSNEVEREVAAAMDRMSGVRGRVAARLDQAPPSRPGAPPLPDDASRLLERIREMIQDATQKGERLSAAGERVSRSAERLVRGLEEEVGEITGLVVRLSAPEQGPRTPEAQEPGPSGERASEGGRSSGLRLLGSEHVVPNEESRSRSRAPGGPESS